MLRKSQIRPGRWMAIMVAVGGLIVFLLLVSVAVGAAPDPSDVTVDGNCATFAGEWPANSWIKDDGDEGDIPDEYDIRDVYATNSQTATIPYHFVRYNTAANVYININATTNVFYDLDDNPNTGSSETCDVGSIGAERYVSWNMQRDYCDIYEWNSGTELWDWVSSDCDGEPSVQGQKSDTCVEVKAEMADLGISTDLIALKIWFENNDSGGPPDDIVCFDYDTPTAVELSSFSATSQSRSADEPGLTSLWPVGLVSGVVAVSAGGLVLWRRKGLAR